MLLQKLIDLAARLEELGPPSYQRRAVKYQINLDMEGKCFGIVPTYDTASKRDRRGYERFVPDLVRTSGVKPLLLVDKPSYVLGYRPVDAPPGREEHEHESFRSLISECSTATNEPSIHAVQIFLDQFSLEGLDSLLLDKAEFDSEGRMTFRVGDLFPIDLPSIQSFWADRCGADENAPVLECIGCGQMKPIVGVHPIPIKPIPGGQTSGNFVVSANAKAFESYGLDGSRTGPTCRACAESYGKALNHLLASELHRVWVSGLAYAFWTEQPAGISWAPVITKPEANEAEVKQLLETYRTGRAAAVDLDPMPFYAVALGASGARVVVRDWLDTTVGEAKRRLGRYFALQELVDPYGEPGMALSLARIGNSTVRDPRKEEPPPLVPRSLLRLAFAGDPLPLDLLFLAVRRNRADQNVTRERAMLIKMVFGSQPNAAEGEETTMSDLDLANREPAYLCGRLLATLDVIQQRALGNPNATIIDKFYGTASSAPASVFGTLMHGAQAHMGKLRRDSRGTFNALEEQLETILEPLATFPTTLTLQDQGLFALGFYHQRAANRRAARERRELRDQGVQPQE